MLREGLRAFSPALSCPAAPFSRGSAQPRSHPALLRGCSAARDHKQSHPSLQVGPNEEWCLWDMGKTSSAYFAKSFPIPLDCVTSATAQGGTRMSPSSPLLCPFQAVSSHMVMDVLPNNHRQHSSLEVSVGYHP